MIGHATDLELGSGVTAIVFAEPIVVSVAVLGGAPGGRELGLLEPDMTIERVDAVVLAGGSAFGLDAAGGVQAALREDGRGLKVAGAVVPLVPTAILFDLGERRRQGMGPVSALSRPRLRGGARGAGGGGGARQRRRRHRGNHGDGQGRDRQRQRPHGLGAPRRRHRGGQRARHGNDRRRAAFLGGAVRGRGGVRRPRLAAALHAGRHRAAPEIAPASPAPRSAWSRPMRR